MSDCLKRLDNGAREAVMPAPPPTGSDAMKATLTKERFSDPAWMFERKLDGVRCIAIRSPTDGVRLLSRNDLSLNGRYSEVADALGAQRNECFAVDGEIDIEAGAAAKCDRRDASLRWI